MASSHPNPEALPGPSAGSESATARTDITDASHASYQDGALTWDNGKISDEDIVLVTSADDSETGRVVWSLPPADPGSDPDKVSFTLQRTTSNIPLDFLERHTIQALPDHLDPENHTIYILISTRSGTGLALSFFLETLRPLLRAIGLSDSRYEVIQTENAESVKTFTRSTLLEGANKGKRQTVLLLSGDGGIVDTVNGLLDEENKPSTYSKPIVTLLPLGTGNALFHSLHRPSTIPSIYVQGLRTLLRGQPRALPVFRATFSPGARSLSNEGQTATPIPTGGMYSAVVASYGLHSTLVADSDTTEYRKHGAKRFGLVAKDLMFPGDGNPPHAYKADVTLFKDGGRSEVIERQEHGYLLATPLSNLERKFTISPASKPLDGQLRIVHFGAASGDQAMKIMMEAYNSGNHINLDGVTYESIDGMRIALNEPGEDWKWRRFCIDGLTVAVEENGWMEVRKLDKGSNAVDVLVDL